MSRQRQRDGSRLISAGEWNDIKNVTPKHRAPIAHDDIRSWSRSESQVELCGDAWLN